MNTSLNAAPAIPSEETTCPLCHSPGILKYRQSDLLCGLPGEFGQRQCANCGIFFLSPRVPESSVGAYYPDTYACYQEEAEPGLVTRIAWALGLPQRRRRIVERFVSGGTILDAGCGTGRFLRLFREGPWTPYAMDISRHCHFDFPVPFFEGQFDTHLPEVRDLDAITLWHVFEHFYHPRAALQNAATLLKPGGHLFLAVPDLDCLDSRIFGRSWAGWDPPRHIATYARRPLENLLREAGLQLVAVTPDTMCSEFLLISLCMYLRDHGIPARFQSSLLLRALIAPLSTILNLMGFAPAKVYIARK